MTCGHIVPQIASTSKRNIQNDHKNTTAIRPDPLTIKSACHDNNTVSLARECKIIFGSLWSCTWPFWRDRRQATVGLEDDVTFSSPRVQMQCHIWHYIISEVYFYNLKKLYSSIFRTKGISHTKSITYNYSSIESTRACKADIILHILSKQRQKWC